MQQSQMTHQAEVMLSVRSRFRKRALKSVESFSWST